MVGILANGGLTQAVGIVFDGPFIWLSVSATIP